VNLAGYVPAPIPVHHGDMDPESARVVAIAFGIMGLIILIFMAAHGVAWLWDKRKKR
jgi:heme O synthase-like polyprenyltransferase